MDTSDPAIFFNSDGICNHCQNFDVVVSRYWQPNALGKATIDQIVRDIKAKSTHSQYDCIIGLSGGVDSSYLAYVLKRDYDLRVLAIHVDGGWNSEIAVRNIERLCASLDIDLFVHVIDWDEMSALQLAFFRSSLPNQDIPQDHAFFTQLYAIARKFKVKYFLSGSNYATESVLPTEWGYDALDATHLRKVFQHFNGRQLCNYRTLSFFERYIYYPYLYRLQIVKPLNYIHYDRSDAIKTLETIGWCNYGGKHHESIFTKFFQSYYLIVKYGYDKRRAHLSSMILSGQTTRSEALDELAYPPYDKKSIEYEKEYIANKLNISAKEFDRILALPPTNPEDYGIDWKIGAAKAIRRTLRTLTNR